MPLLLYHFTTILTIPYCSIVDSCIALTLEPSGTVAPEIDQKLQSILKVISDDSIPKTMMLTVTQKGNAPRALFHRFEYLEINNQHTDIPPLLVCCHTSE